MTVISNATPLNPPKLSFEGNRAQGGLTPNGTLPWSRGQRGSSAIKADAPCCSLSFPLQLVLPQTQRTDQLNVHNDVHARIRSQRFQTSMIHVSLSFKAAFINVTLILSTVMAFSVKQGFLRLSAGWIQHDLIMITLSAGWLTA